LYKTKIFTSKVYDHLRKTDALAELLLPTLVPICGDIKIEFFHNPRFGGKVQHDITAMKCMQLLLAPPPAYFHLESTHVMNVSRPSSFFGRKRRREAV